MLLEQNEVMKTICLEVMKAYRSQNSPEPNLEKHKYGEYLQQAAIGRRQCHQFLHSRTCEQFILVMGQPETVNLLLWPIQFIF